MKDVSKRIQAKHWAIPILIALSFLTIWIFHINSPNPQAYAKNLSFDDPWCGSGWTHKDESDPFTITDPSGIFIRVGIKASTSCFIMTSDGITPYGCYSVSGIGTSTITVTKVISGPTCPEISHIVAELQSAPLPSDTPSPTDTQTPTNTPTASDTPSPTLTPTHTNTPIPPSVTPTQTGSPGTNTPTENPLTPTIPSTASVTPRLTMAPTQATEQPTENPFTPSPTMVGDIPPIIPVTGEIMCCDQIVLLLILILIVMFIMLLVILLLTWFVRRLLGAQKSS